MIYKISRTITGYVRVKISGESKNRLLNIAIKNKLGFWDYVKNEENYIVSMRIRDFRKLCDLRKRYNVRIKLIKKWGLPFVLSKLRLGLVLGFLLSFVLYIFLFSHYWLVEIHGTAYYDTEKILAIAEENGIYVGGLRYIDSLTGNELASQDLYKIENKILSEMPELSWISINTDGCMVDIVFALAEEKPEIQEDDGVYNMVAEKVGIVRAIEAYEGVPEVSVGSAVGIGDVLISGVWDTNRGKEEWELLEEPIEFRVQADGKVMADVQRKFTESIDKTVIEYTEKEIYQSYSFGFLFLNLPITTRLVPDGDYAYEEKTVFLSLFGIQLPVYIKTETLTRLESSERELSEEEAKEQLLININQKIALELEFDEKIVSEDKITFYEKDEHYIVEYECITYENIAIPYKIAIK
ncbi:MAG: sporulation protein YqfD [Clostridia bacterium]